MFLAAFVCQLVGPSTPPYSPTFPPSADQLPQNYGLSKKRQFIRKTQPEDQGSPLSCLPPTTPNKPTIRQKLGVGFAVWRQLTQHLPSAKMTSPKALLQRTREIPVAKKPPAFWGSGLLHVELWGPQAMEGKMPLGWSYLALNRIFI